MSTSFNPVLGFLSVSTDPRTIPEWVVDMFQSRAGFSECLDLPVGSTRKGSLRFNPVLGFLSVSTLSAASSTAADQQFQSRAGFSECLDRGPRRGHGSLMLFQSRAGFSECLDGRFGHRSHLLAKSFNPVLGFLSVSTPPNAIRPYRLVAFQSRAGFSECLDFLIAFQASDDTGGFQSRAGFSECLD